MRRATNDGSAVGRTGGPWSRCASVLRHIVGAPDYERYVEHCRQAGHPVDLTEADYVKEFFERKGQTPRCC